MGDVIDIVRTLEPRGHIRLGQSQNPGLPLKDKVFDLACKYNQDCFLYKEPGLDSHAYLRGSNADFGIGKEVDLGILRINEMSAENYTKLDGGRISFGQ